jgi:hypothetical protein
MRKLPNHAIIHRLHNVTKRTIERYCIEMKKYIKTDLKCTLKAVKTISN